MLLWAFEEKCQGKAQGPCSHSKIKVTTFDPQAFIDTVSIPALGTWAQSYQVLVEVWFPDLLGPGQKLVQRGNNKAC